MLITCLAKVLGKNLLLAPCLSPQLPREESKGCTTMQKKHGEQPLGSHSVTTANPRCSGKTGDLAKCCITSRKGIADTFGEFYKRLYEDSEKNNSEQEESDEERIPEITSEEIQAAICKFKSGKSPDGNGIRAEDIKDCSEETREMMRQVFNEVIKRNNFTPEEWKKVKIKVIHKKGDVEDVSNYRPICSLPAMHKLFSTILYGRLYPMLDQNQAEDQAGFRKTYQTTDHLATYRMMEQKCQEWGIKM